jgi:hypothetical protein
MADSQWATLVILEVHTSSFKNLMIDWLLMISVMYCISPKLITKTANLIKIRRLYLFI